MADPRFRRILGMIGLMPEEEISIIPKSLANGKLRPCALSLFVQTRRSCNVHDCDDGAEE